MKPHDNGAASANSRRTSRLSGVLLALCFVSYAAYLLNSFAVRHVIAEAGRLIEKFVL